MTLTLRALIAALDEHDRDLPVRFTDGRLPDKFDSWRGVYSELALNYRDEMPSRHAKPPTVGWLIGLAYDAMYATFEGYKGGSFQMTPDTSVWVDNYGDYSHEELVGCHLNDGMVFLDTRMGDDA